MDRDQVLVEYPLPASDSSRDDSLSHFVKEHAKEIATAGRGTGILYIGFGTKEFEWKETEKTRAQTFFVLEINKQRFGISTLHGIMKPTFTDSEIFCYITPALDLQVRDMCIQFDSATVKYRNFFVRVKPIFSLLQQRYKYLETIADSKLATLIQENIDSDFGLQPEPTLDVMFFPIPDSCLESFPPLELAQKMSDPLSTTILIAYHQVRAAENLSEQHEEYANTSTEPISLRRAVHPDRSVSVGKLMSTGGICTVICSGGVGSSGGPYLDENLKVIGINIGGYYDIDRKEAKKSADFSMLHPYQYRLADIVLPENTKPPESKNRNLFISVFHSGFQALLKSLPVETNRGLVP